MNGRLVLSCLRPGTPNARTRPLFSLSGLRDSLVGQWATTHTHAPQANRGLSTFALSAALRPPVVEPRRAARPSRPARPMRRIDAQKRLTCVPGYRSRGGLRRRRRPSAGETGPPPHQMHGPRSIDLSQRGWGRVCIQRLSLDRMHTNNRIEEGLPGPCDA